jgi:polysaccharide export outer membrane protein
MEWLNSRTRALMLLMLAMLLSACQLIPGQRMITPPTVVETGGEYSKEPTRQIEVPITDINLALIRQMRASSTAQPVSTQTLGLFGKPSAYKVGPGDVLQITVWDHPELAAALGQPLATGKTSDAAPGFLVDYQGNVQFPYAGTFHVAGDDVDQIQRKIVNRISKVYKNPEVTVRVASFRALQVYVDGEVKTPGGQSITDIPMSLTEAVSRAGGYLPSADQSRVELIRDGVTYELNLADLIKRGRSPTNIMLKDGDLVRVNSRDESGIYMMGEVNKPATVLPMKNGRLTLSEAISQAGSVNPATAEAKQLFVIRDPTGEKPQIYHLDATSPVSMILANQFELQPKDVVYVDNGALVKFNRVLNLFLPAINTAITGVVLTK